MFSADSYIDTVQNGKIQFINTFVKQDAIKEALVDFVDAQTKYTKEVVKTATEVTTTLAQESVKAVGDLSKLDFTKEFAKFGDFTKASKSK
jgi:DNA transposition AAA+ family ATPase